MKETERLEQLQKEWRDKLQKSYLILVISSFFVEAFILCVRFYMHRISADSILDNLARNLLLPTLLNAVIYFYVSSVNGSVRPVQYKNVVFVHGAMAFAMVISTFHGYLAWTYCMYALPIIISVVFASRVISKKLLFVIIPLSFVSIFLSCQIDENIVILNQLIFGFVNAVFLIAVYLICATIIDFLASKNEIIENYDKNEESLNHALTLDSMTSLYNHAEFNRVIEKCRTECCKFNHYLTLSVVDIDHFKNVNDTYGHVNGDEVLLNVANQLLHFCSDKGQVFRYGGEEFAVIFMDKTATETLDIMEQLRDSLSKVQYDFMPEGERVTVSIGIYKYGGESEIDVHDIFNNADTAMYKAKISGRNRCCIYSENNNENARG